MLGGMLSKIGPDNIGKFPGGLYRMQPDITNSEA